MGIFRIKAQGEIEHYSAKNEKHLREKYFEEYGQDVNLIESVEEIALEDAKEINVHCEDEPEFGTVTLFEWMGGVDSDDFELLCSTNL